VRAEVGPVTAEFPAGRDGPGVGLVSGWSLSALASPWSEGGAVGLDVAACTGFWWVLVGWLKREGRAIGEAVEWKNKIKKWENVQSTGGKLLWRCLPPGGTS
jgi:hypothetical protein